MDSYGNNIVSVTTSFTAVPRDAKLRMLAYALLTNGGSTTTNIPLLKNTVAAGFQGWNDNLQLNALIYCLAKVNSLPSDGPALQALVDSVWGIPNGIVDSADVQNLLYYGYLRIAGAAGAPAGNLLPTYP